MLLAVVLAALLGQASPSAPPPPGMRYVTECVPNERVLTNFHGALLPTTVVGTLKPGFCNLFIDELLTYGMVNAEFHELLRGGTAPPPSQEAVQLGVVTSLSYEQVQAFRRLAMANAADARIFLSRYQLTELDGGIVAKLCEGSDFVDRCSRATSQYDTALAAMRQSIREASARPIVPAAPAASSGSSSGYTYTAPPLTRPASSSAPVRVQSESEIRRSQDQCRRGSGPC